MNIPSVRYRPAPVLTQAELTYTYGHPRLELPEKGKVNIVTVNLFPYSNPLHLSINLDQYTINIRVHSLQLLEKLLNFGLTGHINLGWPWVDVIAACSGTGWKRTLGMSIAEMLRGGVTGGV